MAGKLVNLLFIDDRLSEIAQITKSIRQLGFIVRDARATSAAEIQNSVGKVTPDLIFFGLHLSDPPLSSAVAAVADTGCHAPIIVVVHDGSCPNRAASLKEGARDVVESADIDLLLRICERELKDLHTRKRSAELDTMLKEANERCNSLLDSSREAIAYVHEGAHVYVNHAYLELFGYQESTQLEGLPLMNMVVGAHRGKVKHLLRDFARGKRDLDRIEISGLRADETKFDTELQLQPASVQGEPCVQALFQDISVSPSLELKLTELHQRDMLTGLYNRQHFMTVLEDRQAKTKTGNGSGSLLYILLDQYRQTCEEYGLTTGEGLVKEIAEVVAQATDDRQVLARFSESVITVLSPEDSEQAVKSQAEVIRGKIEDHVLLSDSRMITTTCCIGACIIDASLVGADAIIAAADNACESARQGGGGRVAIYQPSSGDEATSGDHEGVAALKTAMDQGGLTLLFQPIASLKDAHEERYTVGAMIRTESGTLQEPATALRSSKENDVFADLDAWALSRACEVLAQSGDPNRKIMLFLPVSASSLADPNRLAALADRVPEGARLVVEFPEKSAEKYYRQSLELARRMHGLGAQIALSDFGMSKNAVRLIGLLQPDYIKFSAELVGELGSNAESRKFVDEISEKMRAAGGETIAVDVISAQQLASIWQTPLTLIQGDFVAEPRESMEFDFEQFVA